MKHVLLTITGLFLSVIAAPAFAAPVNVIDFEAKTQLSSRWERPENRKLLLERLRISHSNQLTGEFFESPFKANQTEIQKYSWAYRCATGETSACKVKAVR